VQRRDFVKTVGLYTASVAAAPRISPGKPEANGRPNFVIIIADDVNWNDVGAYGHPRIRTPNIDRMATEGIKFEWAFLTCSSCSPSRSSIMTGRYPHSTGAQNLHMPLPADQVVFARLLKDAGYYTASRGKWHLGDDAKVHVDTVADSLPSGCEKWTDALRGRPKDKPFLMWFASHDAHRPYKPNAIAEPHTPEDAVVPPFLPDVAETRTDLALYYDEVARLDGYVGEVLDELARQKVADDTVVLFVSDNGRPFPRCKTTVYDSGVRTPFIVRWPGKVKPGTVCTNLVSVVDIAPTIVELAGLECSPTFQGKSFVKMLTRPETSIRDFVFAEHNWHDYQAHERAVRSKRYLYIRNAFPHLPATPPADVVRSITYEKMQKLRSHGNLDREHEGCFIVPRPSEELYDTLEDPYSLNNIASDREYGHVLEQMRRVYLEWARRTDDRVPANPAPDGFDRHTGKRLPKSSGQSTARRTQ